jgi:hypothetical protein
MDEDRFDQLPPTPQGRAGHTLVGVAGLLSQRNCGAGVALCSAPAGHLSSVPRSDGPRRRQALPPRSLGSHAQPCARHDRSRSRPHGCRGRGPRPTGRCLGDLRAPRRPFPLIRCEQEDSPVWALDENSWELPPVPVHVSLLDWLEFWCEEAEAAIRDGYFDWSPRGPRP